MEMWRVCCMASLCVAMATSVLGHVDPTQHCGDPTGYNCQFTSNNKEMLNVPIKFDKPFPSWLTGTLVRNGVDLFEVGDQAVSHVFDGFAKLASWKFYPNGTTVFSTQFIKSRIYNESIAMNRVAPFLLFAEPKPPFPSYEKALCFINGIDNMNVNIWDFPMLDQAPGYAILTEYWAAYEISIKDLSTIKRFSPELQGAPSDKHVSMLASPHPLPEPGTKGNRLTFLVRQAILPHDTDKLDIVRMSSVTGRELVAEFEVKGYTPYMHSFSVTQTKAVMLAAPLVVDQKCILQMGVPIPCIRWLGNLTSTLYIANFKTGAKYTITMPPLMSLHHLNAYDLNDNEIIMDVSSFDHPEKVSPFLMFDVVRNSTRRSEMWEGARNKRLHINLKTHQVQITNMSTDNPVTDGLDMPAINEMYRSKHYCYLYGLNAFADGKNYIAGAVLKKNMCKGGQVEAKLLIEYHYPQEPWFVPNPDGTLEDDGVLLVPLLRGKDATTYLAVVDPKNMTIISQADLPTYIPFSIHGRFFKDAFI